MGASPSTEFRDAHFEFGKTYLYTVRNVAQFGADSVESADSVPAVVTPRDVFPPAAPTGLEAAIIPATPEAPAYVELSWAISPEGDLAGYYVYRSDAEDTPGERVSAEILPSPTFRDMSVLPGRRYYYRVSAVDRAGNESPQEFRGNRRTFHRLTVRERMAWRPDPSFRACGGFCGCASRRCAPASSREFMFPVFLWRGWSLPIAFPQLEPFAEARNLDSGRSHARASGIPVLRFSHEPGQLFVAGLTAWTLLTLTYLAAEMYFSLLESRMGALSRLHAGRGFLRIRCRIRLGLSDVRGGSPPSI